MILTIAKQLRAVPYVDMIQLSAHIAQQLGGDASPQTVAAVLANLIDNVPALSQTTIADEKVLRDIFSRKRTVNVARAPNGWVMDVPTLNGSQVIGTELRPMFHLMLDQIITMKVLSK